MNYSFPLACIPYGQKFNSLIIEIVFLQVDVYFSDNQKIWTCVMKMLFLLNALDPSYELKANESE